MSETTTNTNATRLQGHRRPETDSTERRQSPTTGDSAPCDWGRYAAAIERWEQTIGRPAPSPTDTKGLNPVLVEWMMGLPEGWVTDLGLSRTAQLKMLGNGVVPQQAALALTILDPA